MIGSLVFSETRRSVRFPCVVVRDSRIFGRGRGLLSFGTLKSAVSQEWIDELGWFFASWYKFRKAKSYFNNYWVGVVRDGQGLIDHGTLKPFVSHKWFDELCRLIEWFLDAGSDRIIFYCTQYLWHLSAGGPLQVVTGNLNKNWYCLLVLLKRFWFGIHDEVLNSHDWSFCYNEFYHDNRRKWKSMNLSMDLYHSNNMKAILPNFAKDHCFWTLRTLNYADCISFACIHYFHVAHNQAK